MSEVHVVVDPVNNNLHVDFVALQCLEVLGRRVALEIRRIPRQLWKISTEISGNLAVNV